MCNSFIICLFIVKKLGLERAKTLHTNLSACMLIIMNKIGKQVKIIGRHARIIRDIEEQIVGKFLA